MATLLHSATVQQSSGSCLQWIIRPATLLDRDTCTTLLEKSYHTLLQPDYTKECLTQCLPIVTQPRNELLTCQTWYVVEHPSTLQMVGCGGWTVSKPKLSNAPASDSTGGSNKPTINSAAKDIESPDATQSTVESGDSNKQLEPPHLRHFAVHPDFVRMGIASALWNRCQTDIEAHFSKELLPFPTIEVFSTLTAKLFYQSLGFVPVKHVDLELVKGAIFSSILMRRDPLEPAMMGR